MSLIDCKVKVDKKPDPKGDRVVLTFECVYLLITAVAPKLDPLISGKFLPYAKW